MNGFAFFVVLRLCSSSRGVEAVVVVVMGVVVTDDTIHERDECWLSLPPSKC